MKKIVCVLILCLTSGGCAMSSFEMNVDTSRNLTTEEKTEIEQLGEKGSVSIRNYTIEGQGGVSIVSSPLYSNMQAVAYNGDNFATMKAVGWLSSGSGYIEGAIYNSQGERIITDGSTTLWPLFTSRSVEHIPNQTEELSYTAFLNLIPIYQGGLFGFGSNNGKPMYSFFFIPFGSGWEGVCMTGVICF